MTATQNAERREHTSGEHPLGDGRRRQPWYLAIAVAILGAVIGLGAGWLLFSDDSAVSDATEFPTGRFVNEQFEMRFFEFDADGTYFYSESTGPSGEVSGTYGIRGDLYTEMTHDYPGIARIPATYRWAFDGDELTFELVGEDVISHRRGVYGNSVYIRGD